MAIPRLTQYAGQSRMLLTLTHAAGDHIKSMISNIRKGLDHVLANAPQLTKVCYELGENKFVMGK
ncbi:hypothetical protein [Nitrosomonas sp. Is79A3]|uniref:hypothetical protein n=1 Tax=Nitrosomonas sp. (strain Is79A3) TaxID=261292 RepID=UPI00329A752E